VDSLSPESAASAHTILAFFLSRAAYTGPVARFRREADDEEHDFYADTFGNLNTQADMRGDSLRDWNNGASGKAFCAKWFDQSESSTKVGNHALQPLKTSQPYFNFVNNMLFFPPASFLELPEVAISAGTGSESTVSFQHGVIRNLNGGIVSKVGSAQMADVDYSRNKSIYKQVMYEKVTFYGSYAPSSVYLETFNKTHRCAYTNGDIWSPKCADETEAVANMRRRGLQGASNSTTTGKAYVGRSVDGVSLNGNFASLNVFLSPLPIM